MSFVQKLWSNLKELESKSTTTQPQPHMKIPPYQHHTQILIIILISRHWLRNHPNPAANGESWQRPFLSKTSMLVNFLPTGTLLTFEMVLPRNCSPVTTMMIHLLLGLCALSCFFFHFTDSFRGPDGKVYYGFVTPKGLALFKPGLKVDVPNEDKYKMGLTDFVHAIMSVMVFVAIAFSDHRVTDFLFPGHEKNMDEVMNSFPLMVGIICSALFLLFPNTRYGVGCMVA